MIWLVLACTATEPTATNGNAQQATPPDEQSARDTGPPALPDISATGTEPSLTPAEVAERISTAWTTPPDPGEIVTTYAELMRMGDPECPGDELSIRDQWLYGCTADTGYSYAGVAQLFYDTVTEGSIRGDMSGVSGDFWIDSITGATLEGGGHAVVIRGPSLWVSEIAGSWRWGDGSPWLAQGFSGNLWIEFVDDFAIQLRGAADIMGTYVAAQEVQLTAYCDYGLAGKLSLRDPSGGWYSLEFGGCETCTDVYFEGEKLGEACVDMSGLVNTLKGRL